MIGSGRMKKEKYNAAWVFVKNKIKLLEQIGWNEEFHVECFLSSITRAAAARPGIP